MNNDRFKDKMKKLEQERDEFVEKLTPEGQQEYQQKKEEYNQGRGLNPESASLSDPQE
jgi:F0F1-type ATP synthase membrane subunit b/b'